MHRVAVAGALRVSEQRAVEMISAAGTGAILCSLGSPDQEQGFALADAMLEAVLSVISTTPPTSTDETLHAAVSLTALTPQLPDVSDNERHLMTEWLNRAIDRLEDRS